MLSRQLELHRMNTHSQTRVQMAAGKLAEYVFRYGGHIGTYLIFGGYDVKGPQLMEVTGDGNMYGYPYLTLGSGSLAAMGIFESTYKDNMTEKEAFDMCVAGIEAGIYHDLGSGSNVDLVVIKKNKVEHYRNHKSDNRKMFDKPGGYTFSKDKVQVLEEYRQKLVVEAGEVPMDLS